MKLRRIAVVLIVLLCASALLTGTLLILHGDHTCHESTCTICMAMAQRMEHILGALAILTAFGLLGDLTLWRLGLPAENRYVPGWTLVQRKVKLLD